MSNTARADTVPLRMCELCHARKPVLRRPKTLQKLCKPCFYHVFETEIHNTIMEANLFHRGERVAIGASGGKDSTVLAHVMKTLNERYDYGVEFVLLSIDEGITGYRDDSLETVKRNKEQYSMDLEIVSYSELYGWSMDQIVAQIGNKNNCTYCGVFRRQALDRGSVKLGLNHILTGHNADDLAETILMNLLRGDVARLDRCTEIVTDSADSPVKRSKPFKYTYEKEIVLYAHYKKLDYFSTECTYSPEAFRGTARTLIKNLEAVRPSSIIDIIKSGESFTLLKNQKKYPTPAKRGETVIASNDTPTTHTHTDSCSHPKDEPATAAESLSPTTSDEVEKPLIKTIEIGKAAFDPNIKRANRCETCGYLSMNKICKACILLEGLNAGRAKLQLDGNVTPTGQAALTKKLEQLSF